MEREGRLIGLAGPCAAGKSTLQEKLIPLGYRVRHIAQDHSYVQDMWKRRVNPDVLIFLDVSYPVTLQRRKISWSEADYQEETRRLAHARAHADLYLDTDDLTPQEVFVRVSEFLKAS